MRRSASLEWRRTSAVKVLEEGMGKAEPPCQPMLGEEKRAWRETKGRLT